MKARYERERAEVAGRLDPMYFLMVSRRVSCHPCKQYIGHSLSALLGYCIPSSDLLFENFDAVTCKLLKKLYHGKNGQCVRAYYGNIFHAEFLWFVTLQCRLLGLLPNLVPIALAHHAQVPLYSLHRESQNY